MTVTAVTSASFWDPVNVQGNPATARLPLRGGAAVDAGTASMRTADDRYTPGGTSPSLLSGVNTSSSQAAAGPASTAGAGVLSQLEAAISAAASDGSKDSNWMNDLVSYAGGMGGGAVSSGGSSGAGGALAGDLNTIEGVIQQVTAQVSGALAAQGASASMLSSAVNALRASLTLNSLGAVAQQIAAKTGSQDTFTVTSSVVAISTNGANTLASLSGETESFSGAGANLAVTATGGTASVTGVSGAAGSGTGNATSLSAQGFGFTFSIAENGPDGSAYAETSEASASATETSGNGSGRSVTASAAVAEGATVYESASGTGGAGNALVLLSDWEAGLESTTQTADAKTAEPAQAGAPTLADYLNMAAHAFFKHALALLHGIFGGGSGVVSGGTQGNHVDVYA